MRSGAGFDTNQARPQFLEEGQHVAPLDPTTQGDIALRIDAMNLKNRLRDVETNCRNRLHDLAPPNRGRLNSTHIRGTHVPVEEPSTASNADNGREIISRGEFTELDIEELLAGRRRVMARMYKQ